MSLAGWRTAVSSCQPTVLDWQDLVFRHNKRMAQTLSQPLIVPPGGLQGLSAVTKWALRAADMLVRCSTQADAQGSRQPPAAQAEGRVPRDVL